MGGCRCSYRSCTYATNGKTHFFHYPVRDSTRCAKWIANANRPEFHNLSHSQLKNKVVCEYHFVDSMFMNYKHDRLIHTAIPTMDNSSCDKSDFTSPLEPLSKQTNIEIDLQDSYTLLTDVSPTDREASTMTVNVSPITGFSFIPPHEKRSKNTAPYIELLTRQHVNQHLLKRPTGNHTPSMNKNFKSCITERALTTEEEEVLVTQPTKHYNIESKDNVDISDSNNIIIADLFKTPPKLMCNTYNKKNKQKIKVSEIPRKKLNLGERREHVINDVLRNKDSCAADPQHKDITNNAEKKPIILSNKVISEGNITMENKPILFVQSDVSLQTIDKTKNLPAKECIISDPVNIIHQQLIKYSKQKNLQTSVSPKKVSSEKIDKILSNTEREVVQIVQDSKIDESSVSNDYMKLIHKNSKEISELKQILLGRQTGKKYSSFKRQIIQKSSRPKRLSKEGLYAQIVPYLSPELARKVHSEMFPSTLRYKR